MSAKVQAHFRRLFKKVRLEGLWRWQTVAAALRQAGVPLQTGTVCVERFWASLDQMLPRGGRRISPQWFEVLSMLAFFRYNGRHFAAGSLPKWCERDYLLAQRIDGFVACAAAVQETGTDNLSALFDPFQP